MTIRTEILTDGSVLVELNTLDDWQAFVADNHDVIAEQYGSTSRALRHLMDGGLILGGGAVPEVGVYFKD